MSDDRKALIARMIREGKSNAEIKAALRETEASGNAVSSSAPASSEVGGGASQSPVKRFSSESTVAAPTPTGRGSQPNDIRDLGRGVAGLARSAAQGATLGFADEIEGALRGALPGRTVSGEIDKVRGENAWFKDRAPGLAFLSETAGGVAPITKLGTVAKEGFSLGKSMLRAALTGGAYGAASGAGHAEGGVTDRLGDAAVGALGGGTVGTVIPALGAAGSRVASELPSLRRILQSEAGAVGRQGTDETAALMERLLGGSGKRERRALDLVAKRAKIPETLNTSGKPVVAADVLGEETQKLFGTSMNIGNPAVQDSRTFLAGRAQNRPARMAEDVTTATKTTPVNLTSRAREIAQEEAPAVTQAYERASAESPKVKLSPQAKAALSTPAGKRAYQSALSRAADKLDDAPLGGITYGDLMKNPTRETLDLIADRLTDFQASGGKDFLAQVVDEVDVRTLDAVKQRLDVMIGQAKKAGDKTKLRDLVKVKDAFVSDAEGQAPLYTQAKGLAQETTKRAQAVKTGATLGKGKSTPDEIAAAMDGLSPLEEEEVRNAAAQVMRQNRVANPGTRNAALNPEQDLAQDQQLRALFGPEEARELGRLDALERTMRQTERAPGGSQTFGRAADAVEIAGREPTVAELRSPVRAILNRVGESTILPAWRRAMVGGPDVAAGVVRASMAGSKGADDLSALLDLIRRSQRKQGGRNALAEALAGVVGQGVGRIGS